ncbi:hypothetical protein [Salibacterium lacus]|uniref:Carboxymuconolactone decarboxylase family protein n=1 Tax=Salibacterium lacus TaxID=1898109 RepID=A0ABW5T5E5_9BACI
MEQKMDAVIDAFNAFQEKFGTHHQGILERMKALIILNTVATFYY